MEKKYYELICQAAQAYKYGYIHQDTFLNNLGNFVMWKVYNSITPNIEKLSLNAEGRELFNAK